MDTSDTQQSQEECTQTFDLTIEEKGKTNRLNLHCVPDILDKAIRMRLALLPHRYICQEIVERLVPLYRKEIEQIRKGEK